MSRCRLVCRYRFTGCKICCRSLRRANMGSAKREKRWKSIKSNRNKITTSSYFQHLSAATKFWPKRPFYARSYCSLWHYRFSIYLKYTVQGCRFAI
ncbi:BnaC09g30440D [Brassica napus]|uniref:BnaC09g30440D protein n=1 Tax=Brassica napus TaxID=3708 RepID=A0A078FYP3_BRANA|nr:BnaC09g30440D [Brassica napus]